MMVEKDCLLSPAAWMYGSSGRHPQSERKFRGRKSSERRFRWLLEIPSGDAPLTHHHAITLSSTCHHLVITMSSPCHRLPAQQNTMGRKGPGLHAWHHATAHSPRVRGRVLLLLQLDHVVDAKDGDRRLHCETEGLDLRDGRLHDAGRQVVADAALDQIETRVLQLLPSAAGLRGVVIRAEARHELGRVLGGVDAQHPRDDKERLGELGDRHLLARRDAHREGLEVHAQRGLHRAPASHKSVRLEHPLHDHERIVQRAVDLVYHVLVGAAQDERAGRGGRRPADVQQLAVPDPLLVDGLGVAQVLRVERFVPLQIREGADDLSARGARNATHVLDLHAAACDRARLDEVL
mmetsp:Transcript_19377/g.73258  ORF Transcript_19377/g.73258 Transcript_19377/m.73258 type:complete len:350 (+) Transcript_19377:776-1825(+)